MNRHVSIKIDRCGHANKIEVEFEAPDNIVKLLKNIILQVLKD
jgi:hypothetical protein